MSRYELARHKALREVSPRSRDDSPGFPGQANWGAAEAERTLAGPDANPADDSGEPEFSAQDDEFAAMYQSIMDGTAPAAVLDRAIKCATECARMTGRPVSQFLADSARTITAAIIHGD